jgi:hypothetical protein
MWVFYRVETKKYMGVKISYEISDTQALDNPKRFNDATSLRQINE